MPEVIELLSSSPPPVRTKSTSITSAIQTVLSEDLFKLDSDDFDLTGDLDFSIEQPSKRRRLTPVLDLPSVEPERKVAHDEVLDLRSDGDDLPDLSHTSHRATESIIRDVVIDDDDGDDDVFRFSSSAPEAVSRPPAQKSFVLELSSDPAIEPDDPIQSSSQPVLLTRPVLSARTANLLAGLRTGSGNDHSLQKHKPKTGVGRSLSVDLHVNKMDRFKQITKSKSTTREDLIESSQPKVTEKSKSVPERTASDKTNELASKPTSKAEKDAAKEAEKERKRKEKEQKAQEKQKAAEIAGVNKSKTNKKNSTSEMIVDMPAALQGLSVGKQVEEYMKQLEVQVTFSREEEINLASDNEVSSGHIVRWRRRVVADYDDDQEIWKPLPQTRITREKHTLVFLKAEEFINIAVIGHSSVENANEVTETTMKQNLDKHVQSLRKQYPGNTLIYLIEGLAAWNRKSQTTKNRAYTAAVRSQTLPTDDTSTSTSTVQPRRKRKPTTPQVDLTSVTPSKTETLLLHLQLHHQPLLIQHTTSPTTTATHLQTLTQHLSTRPYRLADLSHNLSSASFCMATGQIRTGSTPHETYINMLQEINRVTPSMAYGISGAGYGSVGKLVGGFREGGNLVLEDVRKSVNKDGGWSDRRLGPMVSKRLYRVFMGRDAGARDGIA